MRHVILCIVILLLVVGDIGGAHKQGEKVRGAEYRGRAEKQQPPAEIQNLIDDALAAPPEFSADILIRVATSGMVSNRARKLELLADAFRRASSSQHLVRRAYIGGEVDTRAGYLSNAYDLGFDSLTLQNRAVKAILKLDNRRARELFSLIPPKLPLEPLNCQDALVYDVSFFYETLGEVAKTSFSPVEVSQDEHAHFVARYVEGMTSPSQVWPASKVIIDLKPSASQLSLLIDAFGRALKSMPSDDRSFSYSMARQSNVIRGVLELLSASAQQGVSARELKEAFRSYLVRSLGAGRCGDNVSPTNSANKRIRFIEDANKTLRFEPPIAADDIKPLRIEGSVKNAAYWESPEAKRLLSKARGLRFGKGNVPLSDADRQSQAWQTELSEALGEIARWDVKSEKSASDYLHQKGVLFRALLDLTPAGTARDEVLLRLSLKGAA